MKHKRPAILWRSMKIEPPRETMQCLCKTIGIYFISKYDADQKDWLNNAGVPLDKWMPGYKDVIETRKGSFITLDDVERLMSYEYERFLLQSQE